MATPAAVTVFTTVLTQGPLSRVEVSRRTGLSPAAVTKATRPFIEAGYLEEVASADRVLPGSGRPANPLAVRPEREMFLGVKITGDDLIGVVTDLRAQVRASFHHPLQSRSVDAVVADLAELVEQLVATVPDHRDRIHCLGVAISGEIDRTTGMVRYSPFLGWRDVPLGALLTRATGLATILENDVKAVTVAEQWFGEGVGASSFALVTVGAGIGCGVVVQHRLLAGAFGVAGELGHLPVMAGPECHCGAVGCLEAVASSEAIAGQARLATGEDLDFEAAVERARSGDVAVREVFGRAGHAIGLGLAAVANLLGPQRIVVSGEGLAAYDLLEEQIRAAFGVQAFGAAARCGLTIRPLPFEEWARGAAAVAIQTSFTLTDM